MPPAQESVDRAVERLAAADGLRMSTLVVSGADRCFVHDFTAARSPLVDLRSITKAVVALAVGVAIGHGTRLRGRPLSLDLPIRPYFPDLASEVRLRHLLTSTTGHAQGFLFRQDVAGREPDSLLEYVFTQELIHPPGTHFAYSNAGWYLLSALVRDELGVALGDWVEDLLLAPLGITDVTWVRYGRYEAAASGLSMSARDLARVGRLLLAGGVHEGRRVVPESWIATMRTPAVEASGAYDPPLRAHAYGVGLWICDDGIHYCDGTGGQFLIVSPRTGTVVVALAEAGDTAVVARCLGDVL